MICQARATNLRPHEANADAVLVGIHRRRLMRAETYPDSAARAGTHLDSLSLELDCGGVRKYGRPPALKIMGVVKR